MIHAIGDSHAVATFAGISGVATYHVGPVTMHRVGRPEEPLLPAVVAGLPLGQFDVLILCFGEIDVRCHIGRQLDRSGSTLEFVVHELVNRYLAMATTLVINDVLMAVLAVVPPVPADHAVNPNFPVVGTNEERVEYTRALNRYLAEQCALRGVLFVDVYTPYCDEHGMLRPELSDGSVHIGDTSLVRNALADLLFGLEVSP